jgi:flagellin
MQAASDGVGDIERGYINTEAQALVAEMDRVAAVAEYNGTMLLAGVATLSFQVGIRATADDVITFDTVDGSSTGLGLGVVDLTSAAGATSALAAIDTAIQGVSTARASFGAAGNRLAETIASIQSMSEALSAANSRIRDVDVAEETSKLSRAQILAQAGVSVLAQANQMPQIALKLLG